MFHPASLDETFGGKFMNLSIWGGIPNESRLLAHIFARIHPAPKTIMIGIDTTWCGGHELAPRALNQFPLWAYDKPDLWDARHLFNYTAVEDAYRQLGNITEYRPLAIDPDGFTSSLPDESQFIPAKVRERIYGQEQPKPIPEIDYARIDELVKSSPQDYPSIDSLKEIFSLFSPDTKFIIFFAPYHLYTQRAEGLSTETYFEGCKRAVVNVANTRPKTEVFDFMIDSPITRDDRNYWDAIHANISTSEIGSDFDGKSRKGAIPKPICMNILWCYISFLHSAYVYGTKRSEWRSNHVFDSSKCLDYKL